jgi:hypothetical protein
VAVVMTGMSATGGAGASAATPSCAQTTDPSTPAAPSPGKPCWTDVTPYPFGADGNPATSADQLPVTSMAFRAWNRGLVTTSALLLGVTDNYGLWIFNGARWFPDPTFPGQSECAGSKVLWAGKLDYWVIGAAGWGSLCRFDGVNYQWEPLPVPAATLARVPRNAQGNPASGGLSAGACFSWDNCWFFGTFGTAVHWDGQTLSDASQGLGASPWLRGGYTAAAATTDAAGNPVGYAVGGATDGGSIGSDQLPAQPDGSPPPQLFGSGAAAFSPLPFSPPTVPTPVSPFRTDLVAVAIDGQGHGWVAGRPVGDTNRDASSSGSAPLLPVSAAGAAVPCSGYGPNAFQTYGLRSGHDSYLWSALSGIPGTGEVLAGGQYQPPSAGTGGLNDDGSGEPALVLASCGQPPQVTRFRIPDPSGTIAPADRTGAVAAIAANAVNDAWAATTTGGWVQGGNLNTQPPHFYHLTDGQPPQAPAGDDQEVRQLVFRVDPPIYVQSPGVQPPAAQTTTTITKVIKTVKKKKAPPPIYAFKAGKPIRLRNGKFILKFTFKVRPPAEIGIEATRGKRKMVVSTTGLRRFTGKRGQLVLTLDRRHWPDHFRFILPKPNKAHLGDVRAPAVLAWTVLFSG